MRYAPEMTEPQVESTAAEVPARRLTRAEARAQTRERLLAAAAEVFKRQGYSGASLEAVAEAAGYTKGAVYSNFATKADLFTALIERWVDAQAKAQQEAYGGASIEEFVNDLDQIFARQMSDPGWLALNIEFWLAAVRDPAIAAKLVESGRRIREASGHQIQLEMESEGRTSPFTGLELGTIVSALASGMALDLAIDPDAVDPKLLVRVARVLVGLDPEPPTGGD